MRIELQADGRDDAPFADPATWKRPDIGLGLDVRPGNPWDWLASKAAKASGSIPAPSGRVDQGFHRDRPSRAPPGPGRSAAGGS